MHNDTTNLATLPNGLRIASERFDHVETVSIGVWIDAGARQESASINGAAHMLEHMAFKGTHTRSALDIALEIENVGGQLNAYTGREQTAYYARTLKDDWPLALDILADILQNSTFDAEELERERHVILQEIGQVNDTPDDLVFDHFQSTAYPDQPMGRSILGPPQTVQKLQGAELKSFMKDHYAPQSMIVSAAGNIDHQALHDASARLFETLPSQPTHTTPKAQFAAGNVIDRRDLDQLHITLGMEGLAFDHDDFYALQTLSMILGGGMSSRLFQEIREKRGLAYSVFSFASCYSDTGAFGIYAGTGSDQAEQLIDTITNILKSIEGSITADELERARNQIKASMMMGLESCPAVCEDMARQYLCFGRRLTNEEVVQRFDAVTIHDIHRIAATLMTNPKPVTASIGPWPANLTDNAFAQAVA